jgi:hypothetical protein
MPALSQKNLRKQEICQQSKLSVQASSAVFAYEQDVLQSRPGMAGPQELHQRTQLLYFLLLYLPNQFNVSCIEYLFTF